MYTADYEHYYEDAKKKASREYGRRISHGQSGYLPSLEGLLKNIDIETEVDIGVVDVPLKKVVGANSHTRSMCFSAGYMPLMSFHSEFAQKWIAVCRAHLTEGLRDPIKVYEYLNWFYVIEGNKRVSVLKYFDVFSFSARVTRLIPKRDENDTNIKIYYEFLEFYKKTGINCIWFSREKRFASLLKYISDYRPPEDFADSKYKYLTNAVYLPFRKLYHEAGGDALDITTGDAFLEYVKLYGIPSDVSLGNVKSRITKLLTELENMAGKEKTEVQMEPEPEKSGNLASAIASLVVPKRKLRIAFAYAKTIKESAWTYSHNMGRLHVEKVLGDQVETSYIENVPESDEAYNLLKGLAGIGYDVVFATSPAFINASLKVALEFPAVKFYNCSETHAYKHVNTYFGRIYEARFLSGIVAGAMTKSNIIGYIGTYPVPEVICGVNSFALGAALVNPRVKVRIEWTRQWDSHEASGSLGAQLIQSGADIISHHNVLSNRDISPEYGVYSTVCDIDSEKCIPGAYLAAPVWNWGIFYERMIKDLLNGTLRSIMDIFGENHRLINFWWGMDSGVVDFFYSRSQLPQSTQKLVNLIKQMVTANSFSPFTGPVYDRKGRLRIKDGETASHRQILNMDWFVDKVESEGEN